MNNDHNTLNPNNSVALLMPPGFFFPWIVDLLQRLGGAVIKLLHLSSR